ncbi:hypothetical protein [Natrinema sp. SYSU A 869]|uniref:hypothetical protein n=1 Tax=Natrinema sp. SYSU A 869 TaxID=2871694 RepID=UPI001CA44B6E|nr:hypothetical protein [Natrinema sp. SYSU A 869]
MGRRHDGDGVRFRAATGARLASDPDWRIGARVSSASPLPAIVIAREDQFSEQPK